MGAQVDDLRGRVTHPLLERSGQVRLIEIAHLKRRVGDRHASRQKRRRLLGALDLIDVVLAHAGGAQEMMAHRAVCQSCAGRLAAPRSRWGHAPAPRHAPAGG